MICIIPARGGSQRIPQKNIKLFFGEPIISYAIGTAKMSGLFDDIIVSTDDGDIAGVAWVAGATDVFKRTDEMSVDNVGTQEVARDLLTLIVSPPEYTCVLYPCSPLITADDLKEGFDWFMSSEYDYAHSVDKDGNDCGNYYFGKTQSFLDEIPLEGNSLKVPVEYACDINTFEDFSRAEQLFLGRDDGHKETMVG